MSIRAAIQVLSCTLIACAALAATAAETERIQLGLGYDRAHDGHGFDLHKAGETYILYFYTYAEDGAPEWLIGTSSLNGGLLSGELLRFSFSLDGGAVPDPTFSGSFQLDFNLAESADACSDGVDRGGAQQLATFTWQTGDTSGRWCTEWLAFGAANAAAPYYGGVWYAGPADPGYGFTMAHMDQTVVAVFYYYDAAGQPRWALGTGGQDDAAIPLSSFDGYCRTCPPAPRVAHDAGSLMLSRDGAAPASVDVTYPRPPGGRFQRDFSLHRLSDGASFADYRPDPALSFFSTSVSGDIVQTRCVLCHVDGGIAGNTRLVFETGDAAGYQARNLQALRDFVATVPAGAELILSKVRGESHGGSTQLSEQSAEYGNLSFLLELLADEPPSEEESFFAGVKLLEDATTLRRASLLFAGRLPGSGEIAAFQAADPAAKREQLRGLMQGPKFHQFLITGANDRLLTDQFLDRPILDPFETLYFPGFSARIEQLVEAQDGRGLARFVFGTAYGVARAPLELIAYVVENDLPYSEILTADYTMVNPATGVAFGAPVNFADAEEMDQWRPARIGDYLRLGDGVSFACNPYCRVLSGGLPTEFPHAGVLNSLAFLSRYPSTATNRNRARARWTYYFFLDVDIERLAARPIDDAALADTDNPTLNNPACTACHVVHDPVAGTFQAYGDEGFYKDSLGGLDSLPDSYKFPDDGTASPYVEGDTWYRDMRPPGFSGRAAPAGQDSLQWLAGEIVEDPRFPAATVKFWWPAVFAVEPLEAPSAATDPGDAARRAAYQAQQALVTELARGFEAGFVAGRPLDLKDLLAEMVLSDWFRADEIETAPPDRSAAFEQAKAGTGRLLTPEQLARKLEAVTGQRWAFSLYDVVAGETVETDFLAGDYRLYYGGIDSTTVTRRVRQMNGLMSKVVENMALEMSCPIVFDEFAKAASQRLLLAGVSPDHTPATELVSRFTTGNRATYRVAGSLQPGPVLLQIVSVVPDIDEDAPGMAIATVNVTDGDGDPVFSASGNELGDAAGGCGAALGTSWRLEPGCRLELTLDLEAAGNYTFEVDAATNPDQGVLALSVNRPGGWAAETRGGRRIKNTLRDLHAKFLDEPLALDDPELERSYDLFRDIWSARLARGEEPWVHNECNVGVVPYADRRRPASDPFQTVNTWIAMTTYFLSDHRFIIE